MAEEGVAIICNLERNLKNNRINDDLKKYFVGVYLLDKIDFLSTFLH